MTVIDQCSLTCNDCGNLWTSCVAVSINTFGMTAKEAERRGSYFYFAGLEVDYYLLDVFRRYVIDGLAGIAIVPQAASLRLPRLVLVD
jgi:hypothetical protein